MKISSFIQLVGIGSITFLAFSCSEQKQVEETPPTDSTSEVRVAHLSAQQQKTIGLTTTHITQMALSGVVQATGNLDVPPQNVVTISAPFGGFMKNTTMLQGMRVRKGDVIATIENPEYIQMQQDFLDLSSQLEFTRAEYVRQQQLAKENVNAEKTLQQAKSSYESLDARLEGLRARLRLINIDPETLTKDHSLKSSISLLSPITGFVTEINVNLGKYVSPTDVIMKIVDTDHLHAELVVFEKDVMKLKAGQRVRFTLANETTQRWAKVYLIGKEITAQRSVRVHCHLEAEDPNLLPGMFLAAQIETSGNKVNVLPIASVVNHLGKSYVFVADGSTSDGTRKFRMTQISPGIEQNGFIEVSSAELTDGTEIVANGAYDLLSSMMNSSEE